MGIVRSPPIPPFRSSALSLGFPTLRKFILTKHRGIVNRARVLARRRETNPAPRQGRPDRFAIVPDDSFGNDRRPLKTNGNQPRSFDGLRSKPTLRNCVRADQQALAKLVHTIRRRLHPTRCRTGSFTLAPHRQSARLSCSERINVAVVYSDEHTC
jgi:hypothetical protein